MTTGLTKKQRDLLYFIRAFYEQHGFGPSFHEMMAHLGLTSKNSVAHLVRALEERGAITNRRNCARSIIPTKADMPVADAIDLLLRKATLTDRTRRELEALLAGEA
jgi:SOS-response transcriptional repressor LexA